VSGGPGLIVGINSNDASIASRQAAKATHVDALAFAPPWRCGCVILWDGTLFEGRDSGSVGINPSASGFQRKSRLIVIAVGDSAGLVVLRRLQGVDFFRQRNNSAGVYHMQILD
jgi:hypothetical protein